MINLEWLRTFKTIYEKGSMTAAAQTLFISQPGVSLHLSSLENHVGYQLFERQPRKLVATEQGKLLYNAIIDSITQLEAAEKNFQKCACDSLPTLTVGMCIESFQLILEKHLPSLPFDLIMEFGDYRELLHKMEQGVIDVVVTPRKIDSKQILFRPFSQENIILVAGHGTDISGFADLCSKAERSAILDWVTRQKWYGLTGDNEHLRRFWQLNFNSHPDFRPNYIVPNFHSIIRCLSAAPGLGVVPDFLCQQQLQEGKLQLLWRGFTPLQNTLYLARRKNPLHPAEIDHIERILQQEMPPYAK